MGQVVDNALDIENFDALVAYLRRTNRIGEDESPDCLNLAGGVSNRTVSLRRENGQAWALKQALPKLRVQIEWLSDPRRIEREALGMLRLADLAPAGSITRLIFLDPGRICWRWKRSRCRMKIGKTCCLTAASIAGMSSDLP